MVIMQDILRAMASRGILTGIQDIYNINIIQPSKLPESIEKKEIIVKDVNPIKEW